MFLIDKRIETLDPWLKTSQELKSLENVLSIIKIQKTLYSWKLPYSKNWLLYAKNRIIAFRDAYIIMCVSKMGNTLQILKEDWLFVSLRSKYIINTYLIVWYTIIRKQSRNMFEDQIFLIIDMTRKVIRHLVILWKRWSLFDMILES